MGVASELDKWQTKRREQREAEQQEREAEAAAEAEWQRRAQNCLRLWPAPPLADADPYILGVAQSDLAQRHTPAGEALAPYVPRGLKSGDIDSLALKRLKAQGLLLIIGAPASGATRTAYEVARADSTRRLVLAPEPPQGLTTALDELDVVSRLAPPIRLLLWLDRVDRFTGPGATVVAMLRRCRRESPALRVVATISSTRYAVWASENPEVAAEFGAPVTLERLPTLDELERAEAVYPGVDVSEGIAAAFTAAAALRIRKNAGVATCPFEPGGGDCTLARPVVEVTIDWGRTGTPRPLPIDYLPELVGQRLGRPQQIDRAHLTHVIEWAATPIPQGASLLRRGGDDRGDQVVTAHTEIIEIQRSETNGPAEPMWMAALQDAEGAGDSEAVGCIGFRAHTEGPPDIAAQAWARVTSLDEPAAQWLERAAAFSRQRHEPSAERPPRERLLALTELTYGPESAETAVALINLGNAWRGLGRAAKARELFERALDIEERAFGPDHPEVASTLTNLGNAWNELGRAAKARELFERALGIQERAFGPDHPEVASTLGNLGNAWRELGQAAKAREFFERALDIEERAFGPDHPEVARTFVNLGIAWSELGEAAQARELYEQALHILHAYFPTGHPNIDIVTRNLRVVAPDVIALDGGQVIHRPQSGQETNP
ncbi:tetratricopeptide repeat protein [Geodermatophilus sp. URMC 62]|uniref:tetratricopeptide repeat protein n=1 Tax=Geodermatophilus sp. URMC 62 TaxID=3423414 RepID=UPI00406C0BCE